MALVLKDRVQETTTTTGTGTVTLAGAVSGFQSFSAIGNGNTCYYAIVGENEWEVGLGTYTSSGTTLSRDTILESSNSGSAVNFSAGTKNVFVTYPAEKSIYQNASGVVNLTSTDVTTALGYTPVTDARTLTINGTSYDLTANRTWSVGTVTSVSWTGGIVSVATATSTPAFTVAGTSGGIPYFSSGTTWASSGALVANALVIGGGAGVAPSTTTTGTGVLTALGIAANGSGGFVTDTGTVTLTNKTLTTPIISSISNTGTLTLPTSTDTLVGRATTDTLTNKRITPRVSTTTSSATPTINTDNTDQFGLTAQTADITSFTTNLSGTPTDGQKLWIYIVGTAARAITWGASFESSTATLPTTTVSTNRLDIGFVWNAATSKWRCVAVA